MSRVHSSTIATIEENVHLSGLADGPGSMTTASGQFLRVSDDETSFEYSALSDNASLITTTSGESTLWSMTIPDNNAYVVEAGVSASDAGGFVNNVYKRTITATKRGNGVFLSNPEEPITDETLPFSCGFTVSGNNTLSLDVGPTVSGVSVSWKANVKTTSIPLDGIDNATAYRLPLDTAGYKSVPNDWPYFTNLINYYGSNPNLGTGTVSPTLRYEGNDARLSGWTAKVGQTLYLTGAGSFPTYAEPTPFVDGSQAVYQKGGTYWQANDSTFADITTNDFWWQLVFKTPAAGSVVLVAKRNAGVGYEIGIDVTLKLYFTVSDGVDTATITSTSALVADTWIEAELFYEYGNANGLQMAICNFAAATNVSTTAIGSITNTNKFTIGADSAGNSKFTSCIGFVSMWEGAGYISNRLIGTHGIISRATQMLGLWADIYPIEINHPFPSIKGTSSSGWAGRTCPAMMEVWDPVTEVGKLFYVCSGWPRICRWKQENGKLFTGYLAEHNRTNFLLQNKDMSTTWASTNGTTVVNLIAGPDDDSGQTTTDGFRPNTTNGVHGWTQAATITADTFVFGCYAKKGNLDWLYLSDDTIPNCWAYFDLNNGVVGRTGSRVYSATIYDKGNGFYLCAIRLLGTVAAHTFAIYCSDTDYGIANPAFVGNNNDTAMYVTLAQVERRDKGATSGSPIPTTTTAVTTVFDICEYRAGGAPTYEDINNCGRLRTGRQGTLSGDLLLRKNDAQQSSSPIIVLRGNGNLYFIGIMYSQNLKKMRVYYTGVETTSGNTYENDGNPIRGYMTWDGTDKNGGLSDWYLYNNGIKHELARVQYSINPGWVAWFFSPGFNYSSSYAAGGLVRRLEISDLCRPL